MLAELKDCGKGKRGVKLLAEIKVAVMSKERTSKAVSGGDWIHLRRLEAHCILGVHPSERSQARPVWLDVSLECDTRPAAKSDRLEDTLNYEMIEAEIVGVAKKGQFNLVEALAESVAQVCLGHPPVTAVRVVVEKPGALPLTQSVAVEILRRK